MQTICRLRNQNRVTVQFRGRPVRVLHPFLCGFCRLDTSPGSQRLSSNSRRRRGVWASKKNVPLCSPHARPVPWTLRKLSLAHPGVPVLPEPTPVALGGLFQAWTCVCLHPSPVRGGAINTALGQSEPSPGTAAQTLTYITASYGAGEDAGESV